MSKQISDCTMKGVNDSLTPSNFIEGVIVLMPPIRNQQVKIRVIQNGNPL